MFDSGEISFYVDLDAGQLDHKLGSLYASLMAEGEIYQAFQVVERALATTQDDRSRDAWERRRSQRIDEMRMFDPSWLPDAYIEEKSSVGLRPSVVLGMFKSSLPHSLAGYTVRTQKTLEAQQAAGFEVVPCTPLGFGDPGIPREAVGTVDYRRLRSDVDVDALDRTSTLEHNAKALFEVALEVKPELIHAASGFYGPDMGLVALSVARALDRPFVYELRGLLPETWSYDGLGLKVQRQASWLRWRQELRLATDAAAVIALGTNIESELIAGGVDRAKIFVVPNGVDLEEFRPSGAGRQGLIPGLDTSRPTIGYISNLGEREGHVVLVEAVAELRQRGVPVNCVIVGDGPMRPAIESAVANQSLEGQVFVTGPVPHAEVKDYYACLDVFVVPRLDDRAARYTTPLKPFEAMAMRIPLIVSDLPALLEIVGEGGERGKAFYCGSPSSLADRIQETLADSEKTSLVVDEAHRWVREERQWAHNAPRYREAFEAASATRR